MFLLMLAVGSAAGTILETGKVTLVEQAEKAKATANTVK
ncbi:hypothetical protein ADICYQ_3070 [Cyclobacterium qasimii M12-11B]|uniref:Uncharacterized protein n=1 Tax=Cyclobacterium qasimii M12-11B TaxID=641524 RepID=S7WV89_9BACT|nr:hypothetical protein ADICYQ_3070 [Cyclobacterium qasimii M12-11B]